MEKFAAGETVKIPCRITRGAFQDEYLVTIQTEKEELTGFIDSKFVQVSPGSSEGFIIATVVSENERDGSVAVQMPGSFFTTAQGRTSVSSRWAAQHRVSVAA